MMAMAEIEEDLIKMLFNQIMTYVPQKRRYPFNHSFFESDDTVPSKNTTYDADAEEFLHKSLPEFNCHIAGCMLTFTTVQDYELHYNSLHRHVCNSCKKAFPTSHLLELHVLETHDALFKIQAQKQNMYLCLVEGCGEKFSSSKERHSHLIVAHHYPHEFRFYGLKQERSNPKDDSHCTTEDNTYMEDDERSTPVPIKYVPKLPKSISFGQGISRGFMPRSRGSKPGKHKEKHWHQQFKTEKMDTSVNINDVKFQDISDSLPNLE